MSIYHNPNKIVCEVRILNYRKQSAECSQIAENWILFPLHTFVAFTKVAWKVTEINIEYKIYKKYFCKYVYFIEIKSINNYIMFRMKNTRFKIRFSLFHSTSFDTVTATFNWSLSFQLSKSFCAKIHYRIVKFYNLLLGMF